MAKCTPSRSRPGTGRSRLCSEPPVRITASNWALRSSALITVLASLVTLLPSGMAPIRVLVLNTTPSASICSTRRSMCDFSILKSGMP